MPENIAGQIPYMISVCELLNSNQIDNALTVLDNILSGLGEILPLADIFQFELFEALEFLMKKNNQENSSSGRIAEILLKALSKFKLFTENPEYIFDEDKDTKYEISSIYKLMQSYGADFWKKQKQFMLAELESSDDRVIEALAIVVEFNLTEATERIKKLLDSENEIVVCEALSALKSIGSLSGIDINSITSKIKNDNIKAIIENLKG